MQYTANVLAQLRPHTRYLYRMAVLVDLADRRPGHRGLSSFWSIVVLVDRRPCHSGRLPPCSHAVLVVLSGRRTATATSMPPCCFWFSVNVLLTLMEESSAHIYELSLVTMIERLNSCTNPTVKIKKTNTLLAHAAFVFTRTVTVPKHLHISC